MADSTAARMTALRPGASPRPVQMPMQRISVIASSPDHERRGQPQMIPFGLEEAKTTWNELDSLLSGDRHLPVLEDALIEEERALRIDQIGRASCRERV